MLCISASVQDGDLESKMLDILEENDTGSTPVYFSVVEDCYF